MTSANVCKHSIQALSGAIVLFLGARGATARDVVQASSDKEKSEMFDAKKTFSSKKAYEQERHQGRPWIEVKNNRLVFRDATGQVTRELKGDFQNDNRPESVTSRSIRSGEKIVVERIRYQKQGVSLSQRSVYSADGSMVSVEWTGAGDLWAAPAGSYFIGVAKIGNYSDGKLRVFDASGKLRREVAAFGWGAPHTEVAFADDGEFGAYLQAGEKFLPKEGRAISAEQVGGVLIFDREGNVVAKLERPGWAVVGPSGPGGEPLVRVLSRGRTIVLVEGDVENTVTAVDFSGKLLWSRALRPSKATACRSDMATLSSELEVAFIVACAEGSRVEIVSASTGKMASSSDLRFRTAPSNLPWNRVRSPSSRVMLASSGESIALAYSNVKTDDSGTLNSGILVLRRNGQKLAGIDLDLPVDSITWESNGALAITQGDHVAIWRPIDRTK